MTITLPLECEGVDAFESSYQELIGCIGSKLSRV